MSHSNFILSPLKNILIDVTSASLGIGDGIETYPLFDYVMQSVFLKMTGAQEQKMKCICWELAARDYDYRYLRFKKDTLGECSSYKEKKIVYCDLIKQIQIHGGRSFESIAFDAEDALIETKKVIDDSFSRSNLIFCSQKRFKEFTEIWSRVTAIYFSADKNNLFANGNNLPKGQLSIPSLIEMYEHLYKHRNRVAHNTLSYQQNLPTLNTLVGDEHKYDNYFIYFALIVLIDNIFIGIYREYLSIFDDY